MTGFNPDDKVVTITRPVTAYGWLRRSEFDADNYDAWELPDGTLWAMPKGAPPQLISFKFEGLDYE